MRGLKASVLLVIVTGATCFMIIRTNRVEREDTPVVNSQVETIAADTVVKYTEPQKEVEYIKPDCVVEEGSFPGYINYEYADSSGIYHVRYDKRDSISLYDIVTGKLEVLMGPVILGNYIHAFDKYGEYLVWEEDNSQLNDPEDMDSEYDWKIYLRKDKVIQKVDEGKAVALNTGTDVSLPPGKLTIYGDFLAFKTYDMVPGTSDNGVIIKLYDIKRERLKAIFSLIDIKNICISAPDMYKDLVVWSTAELSPEDHGKVSGSKIYVYNIKTNSYGSLEKGESLINPLIWEDYIVSIDVSEKNPFLVLLNIRTGEKKKIASSDYSLSPRREITGYSIGEGYVTWQDSHADSVKVYDILNDKTVDLKSSSPMDGINNRLLNTRIFGKTIVYTDHLFDNKSGKSISEVNRYIVLK